VSALPIKARGRAVSPADGFYRRLRVGRPAVRGFNSFTSVTLIKNRRVGVIWNVFIASATADFSSGASTVPMRLPRYETRHLAITNRPA